jgi:hypothetical protein
METVRHMEISKEQAKRLAEMSKDEIKKFISGGAHTTDYTIEDSVYNAINKLANE